MPTEKDFKRLVRQRMAVTGERYTKARTVLGRTPDESPPEHVVPSPRALDPQTLTRWIVLLGDPQENQSVFRLLKTLPPEELLPLALTGTRHENPKVRRRSCRLLDDLALTPASIEALEACARDADPDVRGAALHALACQDCKPDGVCLDQRAIAERAANDGSAKVRRGVAMTLSWDPNQSDDWAVGMATRLLSDASPVIRRYAQAALDRIERQRRTDEERRQLPEPLRTKTERHFGKWVAIEDGGIASVDPPPSWRRRHPNAHLYFVTPPSEASPRS